MYPAVIKWQCKDNAKMFPIS